MLLPVLLPAFLSLFSVARAVDPKTTFDSNGISLWEKMEEMERQILQPATLNSLVSPCSLDFGESPDHGQQTSAEWVRIVFHDMITKGIAGPGLGGLDASISFESDRAENVGIFINVTIGQFDQFTSVFLSMADLIGIGLSDALATCANDHRRLPLRVGRIDAHGPGPAGVPGPADTLAFATAAFQRAGFTSAEMIQAVACGHSLGGVHGTDFPDIGLVPGPDDNSSGRVPFDSTPDNFDNSGVVEYIHGNGTKGGPLVVGHNTTENSDLRIFSSDGNVTIKEMSSAQAFENTCFTIFDKMMNTVPAAAVLSDPFTVRPWIMRESHLDLTSAGVVNFTGTISAHAATAPPATASYTYNTTGGGNTGFRTSQTGVTLGGFINGFPSTDPSVPGNIGFGIIKDYAFGDPLFGNPVTAITVISPGSTYTAPINTNIFVLPSQSFSQQNQGGTGRWMVRVAVLSSLTTGTSAPVVTVWYPLHQANSVASKIVSATGTAVFEKNSGSYKIYKVSTFTGQPDPLLGVGAFFTAKLGTQASAKVSSVLFQNTCSQTNVASC